MSAHWTLSDIAWDQFRPDLVDSDILAIIKAAGMVERNGLHYADYLRPVFDGNPELQQLIDGWAQEEVQHGLALQRWAEMADPEFDFDRCFADFQKQIVLPIGQHSVRGSACGELIARCIVETGTSSYYTAVKEYVQEPVLQQICRRIAADELRHYKLFYDQMKRYIQQEKLSLWQRIKIIVGRLRESEDDELAYAYYITNHPDQPYVRDVYTAAYGRRAYGIYRYHHVDRAIAMILKTAGLSANGWLRTVMAKAVWRLLQRKAAVGV